MTKIHEDDHTANRDQDPHIFCWGATETMPGEEADYNKGDDESREGVVCKREGGDEMRDDPRKAKPASRYPYKPAANAPLPPRGHHPHHNRGPYAPPPYPGYPGSGYGHPPPHPFSHPMMPYHGGGPHPPPQYGNFPHGPPPPPYYNSGPYPPPPLMYRMENNDAASISSNNSKNSKKKRTIDGVHGDAMKQPYTFRRTESSSSNASTVTAGNNTSSETYNSAIEQSPHKMGGDLPPLNMDRMGFEDRQSRHHHRRDMSADASTTSSLSVGGFSLSSYDGPRGMHRRDRSFVSTGSHHNSVGAMEDTVMMDASAKSAPKRRKGSDLEPLMVDTRPPSSLEVDQSNNRFEQLAIDAPKRPMSSASNNSLDSKHQNLFFSLSTSPINHEENVDQTPISKNTVKKEDSNVSSIFKPKATESGSIKLSTTQSSEMERPGETPTPPIHNDVSDHSMADDHSTLNRHLRGQSFTPLPHLGSSGNSPTNHGGINAQLSWSIAGDTPSLGDLADWEDEKKLSDAKSRPSSISPHPLQPWMDDHEFVERTISGTTTPLPAFFEGSENKFKSDPDHGMYPPTALKSMPKPTGHWRPHEMSADKMSMGLPPTPVFASDYRDEGFAARSPAAADRREMDFYPSFSHHPGHPAHPTHNDRIRNLRGRVPPGHHHMPPMPLHIHPGMSSHLPMTSPMGMPTKPGMWSPHGGIVPPHMASPHHMGSPLNNMAQSKRKCVPLKPPIPSKFQGDVEKAKSTPIPDFTSLVNFPAHISQKQAVNLPEGMRCCVMCGQACPCSMGGKVKKGKKNEKGGDGGLFPRSSNGQDMLDKNGGYAIIPTQNKGLCTLCDVNVWIVVTNGLEIKWCKGCKNFRPWASFGDKGLATKCLRCRERQREKYALQKTEKEKEKSRALLAKKEKC